MAESIEIQMLERIKKAGRAVLFLNFYICRQCPFDKLDREDIYLYLPYRKQVTPTGLKNYYWLFFLRTCCSDGANMAPIGVRGS